MQENKQLDYATWFFFFSICFFRHARSPPPPPLQSHPPPQSPPTPPLRSRPSTLLCCSSQHHIHAEENPKPRPNDGPSRMIWVPAPLIFIIFRLIINKHLFCRCVEVAADIVHHVRHPTCSFVSWEEETLCYLPGRPSDQSEMVGSPPPPHCTICQHTPDTRAAILYCWCHLEPQTV